MPLPSPLPFFPLKYSKNIKLLNNFMAAISYGPNTYALFSPPFYRIEQTLPSTYYIPCERHPNAPFPSTYTAVYRNAVLIKVATEPGWMHTVPREVSRL